MDVSIGMNFRKEHNVERVCQAQVAVLLLTAQLFQG